MTPLKSALRRFRTHAWFRGFVWFCAILGMYSLLRGEPPLLLRFAEPYRSLATIHLTIWPSIRARALTEVGWSAPRSVSVCRTVAAYLDDIDYRAAALVGLMAFDGTTRIEALREEYAELKTPDGRIACANMLMLTGIRSDDASARHEAAEWLNSLRPTGEEKLTQWKAVQRCLEQESASKKTAGGQRL